MGVVLTCATGKVLTIYVKKISVWGTVCLITEIAAAWMLHVAIKFHFYEHAQNAVAEAKSCIRNAHEKKKNKQKKLNSKIPVLNVYLYWYDNLVPQR